VGEGNQGIRRARRLTSTSSKHKFLMATFDDYSGTYRFICMERRGGILQMRLHTDGGPLQWNLDAQVEFVRAFTDVGADKANRVVILTGTRQRIQRAEARSVDAVLSWRAAHACRRARCVCECKAHGQRCAQRRSADDCGGEWTCQAPRGPGADVRYRDCCDDVTFEDTAHFHNGSIVPGDGINVVYTMLMGLNRAAISC
jgi:hypothetical protein